MRKLFTDDIEEISSRLLNIMNVFEFSLRD